MSAMVAASQAEEGAQPSMDEILTSDVKETAPLKEQPKATDEDGDNEDGDDEGTKTAGNTDANSGCCCADLASAKPSEMNLGEPKEEVAFFHILMIVLIMYCTMTLTSWARTDGAPDSEGTDIEPNESMFVKVSVEWLTFGFFFLAAKEYYNSDERNEQKCLWFWEMGSDDDGY